MAVPLNTAVGVSNTTVAVAIVAVTATFALNVRMSVPATVVLDLLTTLSTYNTSNMTNKSLLLVPVTYSLFKVSSSVSVRIITMKFVVNMIRSSMRATLGSSSSLLLSTSTRFER